MDAVHYIAAGTLLAQGIATPVHQIYRRKLDSAHLAASVTGLLFGALIIYHGGFTMLTNLLGYLLLVGAAAGLYSAVRGSADRPRCPWDWCTYVALYAAAVLTPASVGLLLLGVVRP